MNKVIVIENLFKEYRLGSIGYGTLREDFQSWKANFFNQPDPNSILEGEDENLDLDRILALNNINLEVSQGERIGIIGSNGAGKTTLLKILSRIASPTKGIVKIKGRVASLIAVGTGFHPELTGRENVYLNGTILGLKKIEVDQRFDEIVDFSGVEQFIDTPIKRYSSGMKIRLGFSVAAHLDPDILVVDEVLAVGDAEFKNKALKIMETGSDKIGRTVLFVSHDLDSIRRLCTRCILLDKGKILMSGDTNETISFYLKSKGINKSSKWKNKDRAISNKFAYLKNAAIINDLNKKIDTFDIKRSIGIKFDFQLTQNADIIIPSIILYNNFDKEIFSAIDTDEFWHTPKNSGLYKCVAWIPGNLLMDGDYFVSIQLLTPTHGKSSIKHFREVKILSFSVYDPCDGKSSIGILNTKWASVVRPLLKWDKGFN